MKKSFTLLEIIFVLLISSILLISINKFIFTVFEKNSDIYKNEIRQLDINSTFIFIYKNSKKDFLFKNSNLYFKNKLILENINSFEIFNKKNFYTVKICTKKDVMKEFFMNKKAYLLFISIILLSIFSYLSTKIFSNINLKNQNIVKTNLHKQALLHLDFLESYVKSINTDEIFDIQIEDKNYLIYAKIKNKKANLYVKHKNKLFLISLHKKVLLN